jgi:hypothetical protein
VLIVLALLMAAQFGQWNYFFGTYSIDDAAIQTIEEQNASSEKFLFYYTHSGFSNQLIGIHRAAQLAYVTGRVLVLPPVLSHKFGDNKALSYNYPPRTAGPSCVAQERYQKFQDGAKQDAITAKSSMKKFPSVKQIINFTDLTANLGLQIMDLPDFLNSRSYIPTERWCEGNMKPRLIYNEEGDKQCARPSYQEMVQTFNQEMSEQSHKNISAGIFEDCNVAVLGSAFNMDLDFAAFDKNASNFFADFFAGFPPSDNVLSLLKLIHSKLPKGYIGVHIRVADYPLKTMFGNLKYPCGDKQGTLYKNVLERIGLADTNQAAAASVLIGRSNSHVKGCFQRFSKGRCNVTTVNDIIGGDKEILRLLENIHLDKSTVYLLLDQILIALAERIEMESARDYSTFQDLIVRRHRLRNVMLAMFENN